MDIHALAIHSYRVKLNAILKDPFTKLCGLAVEGCGIKIAAERERARADSSNACRKLDGNETCASLERALADLLGSLADICLFKKRAECECALADLLYVFVKLDLLESCGELVH